MREALIEALKARFSSYQDVLKAATGEDLGRKLDIPKHKSLAEHLWCVVGARESYAKAIRQGSWSGFGCSLSSFDLDDFTTKLHSSASDVVDAIDSVENWSSERESLLLALSEHEVMHEGQIIRHLYGVEQSIPESVKWA